MDVLFLISFGIVFTIFTFIAARVAKLAYDERQFRRRRALFMQQQEEEKPQRERRQGPVVVGGRRRNVNTGRRRPQGAAGGEDVLDFMEGDAGAADMANWAAEDDEDIMDVLFLISFGIVFTIFTFIAARVAKLAYDERQFRRRRALFMQQQEEEKPQRERRQGPVVVGGRRRNVNTGRRRPQGAAGGEDVLDFMEGDAGAADMANWAAEDDEEAGSNQGSGDEEGEGRRTKPAIVLPDGKVGKKKLAKLEAKAEKRMAREAEFADREEKKRKEAEKEAKEKEDDERQRKEEEEQEELERKEREEKERRDQEEYDKLKVAFAVEEEGFDEKDSVESQNMLREFVLHIENAKVVNMDDVGAKFKLRSIDVANRIKDLLAEGKLTGVLDDRGKFIHITQDELNAVAKFVNQRGRVSISELVDYSNQLINLEPVIV